MSKETQVNNHFTVNKHLDKINIVSIFILIFIVIIFISPISVNADSYPIIILSSESIDFGSVIVGESSDSRLLTVENDQHATNFLTVTEINIEGNNANEFIIKNDILSGRLLETSMSSTVEVVFNPKSAGIKDAILVITNNATWDLELTTIEVRLSGIGIEEIKNNHALYTLIYTIGGLVLLLVLLYLLRAIKRKRRLI